MAYDVKECYDWGVIGCGWLGQAFARRVSSQGMTVWGSARSPETLERVATTGALPVALDLGESPDLAVLPNCRFLLIALPPSAGQAQILRAKEACLSADLTWTTCISSTSVYPNEPGLFSESDAISRLSPHSGIRVLDIEQALEAPNTTYLRAGGLIGPERPLFRKSARPSDPEKRLNVVHIEDVMNAIQFVTDHQLPGPFNLVSPLHRTRTECHEGQQSPLDTAELSRQHRLISAERIERKGYSFTFPDPASFPDLHP